MLCAVLLLVAIGCVTDPWHHFLSVDRDFHVGVLNRGIDSRIVFFNNAQDGPYAGSIIRFDDDPFPYTTAFGDSWGVYYRHFVWPDATLWTLKVSLWYPIVAFAVLPIFRFVRRRR